MIRLPQTELKAVQGRIYRNVLRQVALPDGPELTNGLAKGPTSTVEKVKIYYRVVPLPVAATTSRDAQNLGNRSISTVQRRPLASRAASGLPRSRAMAKQPSSGPTANIVKAAGQPSA